jgi:hypothetical protein
MLIPATLRTAKPPPESPDVAAVKMVDEAAVHNDVLTKTQPESALVFLVNEAI